MIALRLVGRLILAAVAFFLAGLAAAATVYLGLRQLYAPADGAVPPLVALQETGLYLFAAALALGRFPLLLAAAAIIVAELARLRGWLYYAAAGLICGAYALATLADAQAADTTGGREAAVFIAAGLAGGLVYWLVAGRSAGLAAARRSAPAAAEHRRAGDEGVEGGP